MKTAFPFTDFRFDPKPYGHAGYPYFVVHAKHASHSSIRTEVATFPFVGEDDSESAQAAKTMAEQFAYQMNLRQGSVIVPVLDIDKVLYKDTNGVPHARARLEHTIVANLIAHLEGNGFKLSSVYDGENNEKVTTMKEAMELIFNLDESSVVFRNTAGKKRQVSIILGNGVDCISDYSCPDDESDGWSKAMEAFDAEKFNSIYP